jgi:hypothetical protein
MAHQREVMHHHHSLHAPAHCVGKQIVVESKRTSSIAKTKQQDEEERDMKKRQKEEKGDMLFLCRDEGRSACGLRCEVVGSRTQSEQRRLCVALHSDITEVGSGGRGSRSRGSSGS